MSFEDGWAAVHLEMPARIPHTEYSIERHWDLIKVVTGIEVGVGAAGVFVGGILGEPDSRVQVLPPSVVR